MSETERMTPADDAVRATAKVKHPKGHASDRITPPKEVRDAVDMEPGEPWSWFWHPSADRFYIRRSGAHLDGIPFDTYSVGVAEARQNGAYLDFAIPPKAVDVAGMEKGQEWMFAVIDRNTMQLRRGND